MTSTMMSRPTLNVGWLYYPIIGYYTPYTQVGEYFHVSNMEILYLSLAGRLSEMGIFVTCVATVQI